jgi:hypothetical protein
MQLLGGKAAASEILRPAVEVLAGVTRLKCPREMVECLLACSKLVTRQVTAARADGTLPGADEFLPAMILVSNGVERCVS